jgi:GTPase SAR1 family protein
MSYKAESFINDLDKIATARQEFSMYLNQMANALEQAEQEGEQTSGRLSLDSAIEDLEVASKNLGEGVFRLLVLGDMNRGKSTFLNALIGENLLPSDVNPCTAVLTILRYGSDKKVTVHFNSGKEPESLDFQSFKRRYTIDPAEAKKLEESKQQAFPDVAYAVVEYPLTLLEKGVEIVDSPGLNDTEARNDLALGYINNCHAILFVLRATQLLTLGERRYLENYIKGRGLSVFFLVNAWDEIKVGMIDPDDVSELREAEDRLRQLCETGLMEYCQVEGQDLYRERVFELSSINALRQRLKNGSLEGTGFPAFMQSLNTFLTKERAIAELRQARTLSRQTYRTVHEATERRIPLLGQDVEDLKQRMRSVEPEFNKLVEIREQFKDEIRTTRDRQSDQTADSFRSYFSNLTETFEADFAPYQPELQFFDTLRKGKRQEFEENLKQGFQKYINDKVAAWSRNAERDIDSAFARLAGRAAHYGAAYSQVTDKISEKITGQKITPDASITTEDQSPGWAKWAMGLVALASGDVTGVVMAGTGIFNWKSILLNLGAIFGINVALIGIFGTLLGPLGIILAGTLVGTVQTARTRKKLVETMKAELSKTLPQIAQQQAYAVHQAVRECFDAYESEVVRRISEDIHSRKAELDNLLEQKEKHEINRDNEIKRLNRLDNNVFMQLNKLEDAYDQLLGQA